MAGLWLWLPPHLSCWGIRHSGGRTHAKTLHRARVWGGWKGLVYEISAPRKVHGLPPHPHLQMRKLRLREGRGIALGGADSPTGTV